MGPTEYLSLGAFSKSERRISELAQKGAICIVAGGQEVDCPPMKGFWIKMISGRTPYRFRTCIEPRKAERLQAHIAPCPEHVRAIRA